MLICPYYFYRGPVWWRTVLHDHLRTMECNLWHTLGSISWSLWLSTPIQGLNQSLLHKVAEHRQWRANAVPSGCATIRVFAFYILLKFNVKLNGIILFLNKTMFKIGLIGRY